MITRDGFINYPFFPVRDSIALCHRVSTLRITWSASTHGVDDLWRKYTESLVRDVLTSRNITLKPEVLANKLKSKGDFVSTLAEMESAIRLAQQGFAVTLEPMAPEKGPDIRADLKGVPYFVLPGANLTEKHHAIMQKADLIARFDHLGKQQQGTPASLLQPRKNPPEPVKDHERLRNILEQKRGQLPKGERGIIALEVSEMFMLSEFSIESALYGDLVIRFQRVAGPHEPVGPEEQSRNNRGFLLHTSRVSAVVIQNRQVQDGEVKNRWRVYPTNRADADTIRLGLAELRLFGDVEDRDHLSAENAPAIAIERNKSRN
jgi:hypothetical protein